MWYLRVPPVAKELTSRNPGNKLMQNKGQVNVKRRFNSATKPWTQFNYNIIYEISGGNIIDINIH